MSIVINALKVTRDDVFVDVGSGIGNVVAQVALQTQARVCIGIEVREGIANCGRALIEQQSIEHPALKKVRLFGEDFRDGGGEARQDVDFLQASIMYSYNTLFKSEDALALERLMCDLVPLRLLVIAMKPCPRHTARCAREFCLLWKFVRSVEVAVTFKSRPDTLFIYERFY